LTRDFPAKEVIMLRAMRHLKMRRKLTLLCGLFSAGYAGFGVLMSTDLPLQRRQHEMIATVVSAVNACHY